MSTKTLGWLELVATGSLPVVAAALVGMYVQIERQTVILNTQMKEVNELKAELTAVKALYATKPELTEALKSVNQQLEIMVLRAQREKR
jgi:Tfp pilus assembly protein PilO